MNESVFEFCHACSVRHKCCAQLGHGYALGAPTVTMNDQALIKNEMQSRGSCFSASVGTMGQACSHIQTKRSGECIFYNEDKCNIYEDRPIDCRIFPLDILNIKGKYFWVLYDKYCEAVINADELLRYGESLVEKHGFSVVENLATDIADVSGSLSFRILKEIQE